MVCTLESVPQWSKWWKWTKFSYHVTITWPTISGKVLIFFEIQDTTRNTIQKPFVDTCSKFWETSGRNFSVEKTDLMIPETDNIANKNNCNRYFVLIFVLMACPISLDSDSLNCFLEPFTAKKSVKSSSKQNFQPFSTVRVLNIT